MMKVDLLNCPYCGRKARLAIGTEMSDTCRDHVIECDWSYCLAMRDSISYYMPDYEARVQRLADRWNSAVLAILNNSNN
jgi:hypothetical protein